MEGQDRSIRTKYPPRSRSFQSGLANRPDQPTSLTALDSFRFFNIRFTFKCSAQTAWLTSASCRGRWCCQFWRLNRTVRVLLCPPSGPGNMGPEVAIQAGDGFPLRTRTASLPPRLCETDPVVSRKGWRYGTSMHRKGPEDRTPSLRSCNGSSKARCLWTGRGPSPAPLDPFAGRQYRHHQHSNGAGNMRRSSLIRLADMWLWPMLFADHNFSCFGSRRSSAATASRGGRPSYSTR